MLRRFALLAVLAITIAAGTILSTSHRATAQEGSANLLPAVQAAGPMTVDSSQGILIGLLLPAVRQARDPFSLTFLIDGKPVATALLPAVQRGTSEADYTATVQPGADAAGLLVIQQHGSEKALWSGPITSPVQVSTMLLPAVRRNGSPARAISASVQSQGLNGEKGWILPFVMQWPGGDG
ncbi:MAG TPA: hypothetical protein VKT75_11455 [Acidobacteriaceae bacterium]|nr:hypothetical protein [Acidobacteriaceae bacterium]